MTELSSPVTDTLLARLERCAKYDFDSIEMIECKWELWDEILEALGAPAPATALRRIEQDLRTYAAGLPDGDDLRSVLELAANDAASALRNAPAQCAPDAIALAREALKPFALNVGAVSLSKALGHISREHLWAARDALAALTSTERVGIYKADYSRLSEEEIAAPVTRPDGGAGA